MKTSEDYKNEIIFDFDGRDIQSYFKCELKINKRLNNSFDYITKKLGVQKFKSSLEDLKWHETKNYNWCAVKNKNNNVIFLIRKYGNHFTIYSKFRNKDDEYDFFHNNFTIFTYESDSELLNDDENDQRVDNPYFDIDLSLNQLFEIANKKELHTIWNDLCFTRAKHIKVKLGINNENIDSYDLLIFACEELSNFGQQLFAENDILEKIKTLKIGNKFNSRFGEYTIVNIDTEFSKHYSDPYYHSVGLTLKDKDGKEKFEDVYSLCHWHIEGFKF